MIRGRGLAPWIAAVGVLAIAGCAAASGRPTATAVAGSPAPPPLLTATSGPPWLAEPLVDVRTGAQVRLGDLAGHVVFVEGMATWCPPCLEQQHEAASALAQLQSEAVVYVSVDIDPREPVATLRDYVDRNHFGWRFLVATPAFLRELAEAFGATILSPPATPIVVVDATGNAMLTEVGIKRASRLVQLAHALGA